MIATALDAGAERFDGTVLRRLAHWPRLDLGEAVRCAAGRAGVDTL